MSRAEELRMAKDLAWESILASDPEKRAPLLNQWRMLVKELAAVESQSGSVGDVVDELAARRAARGGATALSGKAERGSR